MRVLFSGLWGLLDRHGKLQALRVAFATGMLSLLDGIGLGVVLFAVKIVLDPTQASRVPLVGSALGIWATERPVGQVAVVLFVGVAVFYIVKNAFGIWVSWATKEFIWRQRDRLTSRVFERYLFWPYWRHLGSSGPVLQGHVHALEMVVKYLYTPVTMAVADVVVIITLSAAVIAIEPVFAAAIAILALVTGATMWFCHRCAGRIEVRYMPSFRALLGACADVVGTIRDIKLYQAENKLGADFRRAVVENSEIQKRALFINELPRYMLETVLIFGLSAAVVGMVASGRNVVDYLPAAAAMLVAAMRLLPAAQRLVYSINSMKLGLPALRELLTALAVSIEAGADDVPIPEPRPFAAKVVASDVSFTYPGTAAPILTNVALTIRRGEIIGFVGPSGSGKTTMANILLGLLVPTSGSVLADGRNIHLEQRAWQRNVAFVPQDPYLTGDTLRNNIAFGDARERQDADRIAAAVQQAQLDSVVAALENGIDTPLGDRGTRLSGGQRQRVAIARALYFKRQFLVFDEPTAALDRQTEQGVMQALHALRGRITGIVIAHRLSTIRDCDRIYIFERGRIVAHGPYDELIENSAQFRALAGFDAA